MPDNKPDTLPDSGVAEFMDAMARLFSKAARIEREPVDTGDGQLLHTSEIHLIDMAGRYPADSMSSLASRLGITKGAVSQTVKKLEERGYLERYYEAGDNKTVYLRLSEAGKQAFIWHNTYHSLVNDRLEEVLASMGREDQKNLLDIMLALEKIFDDCPDIRRRVPGEIRQ